MSNVITIPASFDGERAPKDALPVSDCSTTSDPSGFRTRDLRIKRKAGVHTASTRNYL